MMKAREIGNLVLHIVVGFALALAVAWNHWMMVSVTFIYAFLREQGQHRWILSKSSVHKPMHEGMEPVFFVAKQSFFGWITGHRIWEVFQWVIGAILACVVAEFVLS